MRLRNLTISDAPLMLEWMHDNDVVKELRADFNQKTLEDCVQFITSAADYTSNMHLAIADDNDEYIGTVSLKHLRNGTAEFGITIRSCAMGRGYARFGMEEIINKGFTELNLKYIYWCVSPYNTRAIRFYEKNGYKRCACPDCVYSYTDDEKERYIWFCVFRDSIEKMIPSI